MPPCITLVFGNIFVIDWHQFLGAYQGYSKTGVTDHQCKLTEGDFDMPTSLDKITHEALGLPAEGRAKLAHELIASLDETSETNVEAAWDREIERRVVEIRKGKAKGRPAEQVLAEVRAKYL